VEDTPDDLVYELFHQRLWPDHPYGYSILGTPDTVRQLKATDLQSVHHAGYYPGNSVVAVAGRVDHQNVLDLLEHEGWFEGDKAEAPTPPVAPKPANRGQVHRVERDTAQVHLVFGSETFPYRDKRRFALSIITNMFGGGMSSRLFQRIREELGLAYAVYAYQQFLQSAGVSGVYLSTQPATADQAEEAVRSEYTLLSKEALSEEELTSGKQQFRGQVMLSLENPVSRMNRLATFALQGQPYRTLDTILAEIEAVKREDVSALATEFFDPERQNLVRLGPST
jgi:predicted Zn-dependent peptidase